MKSLYPLADIMTLMTKIESNIDKLQTIYSQEEPITQADELLLDSFLAKANDLATAAAALKQITLNQGP